MNTMPVKTIAALLIIAIAVSASAQADLEYEVDGTFGRKLGKTIPLREVLNTSRTSRNALDAFKAEKPEEQRNFENSLPFKGIVPGARPIGPDPLLGNLSKANGRVTVPLVVAEGLNEGDSFSQVPDPNGDVSDNFFVQVVNSTEILVMDKHGVPLAEPFAANAIWTQVGLQSAGDPIVLFDQTAGRWFLAEFPFANSILLAISETEDPLGEWSAYTFNTASFPDYPKFAIWPDLYLLSVNEFGDDAVIFYTINRQQLLTGADTFAVQRNAITRLEQPGVQSASPVGWIGDIPPDDEVKPMIIRLNDDGWGNTNQDQLDLYEVETDWEDPEATVITEVILPTAPYNTEFCEATQNVFVCVPQPDDLGLPYISGIPRIIWHRVSYRNFEDHGSIVLNFGVDVTGDTDGGIRWMELRKPEGDDWSVYQEGTVGSQEGVNRYLGAINIDSKGNIGLAYALSSEEMYPSLAFTGRLAGDPPGEMTFEETLFAEGKSSSFTPRFGDYHSMAVDTDNVFWFTGEYMLDDNTWGTKVLAFRLQKDQNDLGVIRVVSPVDSSDLQEESITVEISNAGELVQDTFSIGLIVDGEIIALDTVELQVLEPDSVYRHTFSKTVLFDSVRTYQCVAFTVLSNDQFQPNDTLAFSFTKLGRTDAAVYAVLDLDPRECALPVDPSVIIQNAGLDTLRTLGVEVGLNGEVLDTIDWIGVLAPLQREVIDLDLPGATEGDNQLVVRLLSPNGSVDENILNSSLEVPFEVFLEGGDVTLGILFGGGADETYWEVLDSQSNIIFAGGPYPEDSVFVTVDWCLDYADCYRFVIHDLGGDGVSADTYVEILNADGKIIATLDDPLFGSTDTIDFCPDFTCLLKMNLFVRHVSPAGASNGLINMFSSDGIAPVRYSIDSGATFQASPSFSGLSKGVYHCLVRDGANCDVYREVNLLECTLGISAEVTDATDQGSFDGTITLEAIDGFGSKQFSINGGGDYQSDPFFDGLAPGVYEAEVKDSLQCIATMDVTVGTTTGLDDIFSVGEVLVYPNPSDGVYFIEVEGLEGELFLPFSVYDITGARVASYEIGNFDGVLKGAFSIGNQPSGVYTLRFESANYTGSVKLLKIQD